MLSTRLIAIQRISDEKINSVAIHCIVIYPMDGVIILLSNRGRHFISLNHVQNQIKEFLVVLTATVL